MTRQRDGQDKDGEYDTPVIVRQIRRPLIPAAFFYVFFLTLYTVVGISVEMKRQSIGPTIHWFFFTPFLNLPIKGATWIIFELSGWNQRRLETEHIPVPAPATPTPAKACIAFSGMANLLLNCALGCVGMAIFLPLMSMWITPLLLHVGRVAQPDFTLLVLFGVMTLLFLIATFITARRKPDFRCDAQGVTVQRENQAIAWGDVTSCEIETQFNALGDIQRRDVILTDSHRMNVVTLSTAMLRKRQMNQVMHFLCWQLSQDHTRSTQPLRRAKHYRDVPTS